MIYTFLHLRTAGFLLGIALIAIHAFALLKSDSVRAWLPRFPRSRQAGIVSLTLAAAWAFWLVATMDLGEFDKYRLLGKLVVPLAYFLSLQFVDEFLAVRAAGMLCLLAAEPFLEAAFLHPETSRLLIVTLAYSWIVIGMFWVGMPYLMRDQIAWLTASSARWKIGCLAGIGYGAAILFCAAVFFA